MTVNHYTNLEKIQNLTEKLNYYRDQYYNKNISEISDLEYDALFDELKKLEIENNFSLPNSPTKTVGYIAVSELEKVKHNHPMLSLDKTKSIGEIYKFIGNKKSVCMAKMDGLTISLRYIDGKLVSAETRGDGETGELVTHNAAVIDSIPKSIRSDTSEIIIDGEVICTRENFTSINEALGDDEKYANPRNYAAGSIRQLDSSICKDRKLSFVAWKLIKGGLSNSFIENCSYMKDLGFNVVPMLEIPETASIEYIDSCAESIRQIAKDKSYPIDGCVFGYDDIAYSDTLGMTSHHIRSQFAFKFYDDLYDTRLRNIEWTIGKTGALTPTAVFDPVIIDGTTVMRASVHNVSIMKSLDLTNGCTIHVYKANQIIPQIESSESDGAAAFEIPSHCPICGAPTQIVNENGSEVLICTNPECIGKRQKKFENFVSKNCANIDGLSESTIGFLLGAGYIHIYRDLYHLKNIENQLKQIPGFGEISVSNLLDAIEKSRSIKLENYINALGIDGIGRANAKSIARRFNGNYNDFKQALDDRFDFSCLDGFGESLNSAIYRWYDADSLSLDLDTEFHFIANEISTDSSLAGLKFCITGSFSESRDVLKTKLEAKGAVFVSSVGKKLDVLFVGENAGSKLEKANQLGIRTANEKELFDMLN